MFSKTVQISLAGITLTAVVALTCWHFFGERSTTPQTEAPAVSSGSGVDGTSAAPQRGQDPRRSIRASLADLSTANQFNRDQAHRTVIMLRAMNFAELNSYEVDHVLALLSEPCSQQNEGWFVTVNELMEQLVLSRIEPARVQAKLSQVLADPSLHFVIRDYAAQHLTRMDLADPKYRTEAFLAALQDREGTASSSIPGTILNCFSFLAQSDPSIRENSQLRDYLAIQLSKDPVSEPNGAPLPLSGATLRSALALAGQIKLTEHHQAIRDLVDNARTPDGIRLSAIAALGQLAQSSDEERLQQLAAGNSKFRHAANAALNHFNSEPQGPPAP